MIRSAYKWARAHWVLSGLALYYSVAIPCVFWPKAGTQAMRPPTNYASQLSSMLPNENITNDVLGVGDLLLLSDTGITSNSANSHALRGREDVPGPRPEDPLESEWTPVSELELMTGSARHVK